MPASDKYWRPLKKMHVVFAISALALLGVTLLMMSSDHDREWKDVQRTSEKINTLRLQLELYEQGALSDGETQRLASSLTEEQREALAIAVTSDPTDYEDAEKALADAIKDAKAELAENEGEREPIEKAIDELALDFDLKSRRDRNQKAVRDKARADFDLAVRDELPEPERTQLFQNFQEQQRLVDENVIAVQRAKAALDEKRTELAEATGARDELQARLKALQADEQRVRAARNKLEPDSTVAWVKRKVMELPIIDGFNSHLRVRQDWLPDLDITLGMSTTARFDRCRTCHVNADAVAGGGKPAYPHSDHVESEDYRDWVANNEYPHPFSTHPRTDLYTTATSPHPVTTFGCTVCHQGNGSGTSFQNAEHGPNDPHQEHEWKEEFGYHSNHFWEYPMYPERFVESSCIKCHHDVVELGVNPEFGPTAPKVYEGFQTIASYGCFGCHEIHGFDGDHRIGPDLRTEPNYTEAAAQLLVDPVLADAAAESGVDAVSQARAERISVEIDLREDVLAKLLADPKAEDSKQADALVEMISYVAELTPGVQRSIPDLAHAVVADPYDDEARRHLQALVETAGKLASADATYRRRLEKIQPSDDESPKLPEVAHLDVRTRGLASVFDDQAHPGKFRKVGPSLRHVESKTYGDWLEYWTEMPKRFRPSTRMPQFFELQEQYLGDAEKEDPSHDLEPVEVAAVVQYLLDKSQEVELLEPTAGYTPDAVAGAKAFSEKGCLACHQHESFPNAKQDFGPNLSRVFAKIKPGYRNDDGELVVDSEGFRWLYSWILEPERHHPRTRMPNLYVNEKATDTSDPAADIAAFLLTNNSSVILTKMPARPAIDDPEELIDTEYGELIALVGEVALDIDFRRVEELGPPMQKVERFLGTLPTVLKVFGSSVEADEFVEELREIEGVEVEVRRDKVEAEIAVSRPSKDGFVDQEAVDRLEDLSQESMETLAPLDYLLAMNLTSALTKDAALDVLKSREYPAPADRIKGDEIELAGPAAESDEEWLRRRMNYIGRRTISRYGCYGCHDIPGFEAARPIGTVLQDWGRKDTSKLATEHIHEYLKHHGGPGGTSAEKEVEKAVARANGEEFKSAEEAEEALRPAYFFEDLMHHGRAGFLWQKLREPRSYDYEKVETKGYDERLRMPLFPLDDAQREAVATFVLGLVAEPPPSEYVYQPDPIAQDRIDGEFLLEKYNCVGCHYVEMPKYRVALDLENEGKAGQYRGYDSLEAVANDPDADFVVPGLEALVAMKPIRKAWVGEQSDGKTIIEFHGMTDSISVDPESPDDIQFTFQNIFTWENLDVGKGDDTNIVTVNSPKITVLPKDVLETTPARGGHFAFNLVQQRVGDPYTTDPTQADPKKLAWQSGPPPLIGEGYKVQTPWLYRFLRNPYRIRPMVVVRMPRFNMSPAEARTLANYFAAKDGAAYPYQSLEEREPTYLAAQGELVDDTGPEYLDESWKLLHNSKVQCYQCHSYGDVGPPPVAVPDPKAVRGPNLGQVSERLRPEWMHVWLSKPSWVLPYTGMPVNYPRLQEGKPNKVPDLIGGNPDLQILAVRDALLNYHHAIEEFGAIGPTPPVAPTGEAPADAAAPAEDAPANEASAPADGAAPPGGEPEPNPAKED